MFKSILPRVSSFFFFVVSEWNLLVNLLNFHIWIRLFIHCRVRYADERSVANIILDSFFSTFKTFRPFKNGCFCFCFFFWWCCCCYFRRNNWLTITFPPSFFIISFFFLLLFIRCCFFCPYVLGVFNGDCCCGPACNLVPGH